MRAVEMAPKPKSPDFDRPTGFDVRDHANRSPWTFKTEAPETIELAIHAEAADAARDDFGPGAERHSEGDVTVVRFACTNPDFAVSKILAAKGAIVVRAGDRLRRRIAEELAAVDARYS
jgi:predicted DNA-binding transcriptional regulator YafY